MGELIAIVVQFGLPVLLLVLGYVIGRTVENRHFARLDAAEREIAGSMRVTNLRHMPANWKPQSNGELVVGSVVIATDYFKLFVSWFQNLFGGNLTEFETLLARGRREAILRVMTEARARGCNVVWNLRVDTVFMGDKQRKQSTGAEIVAYGTAFRV